MEKGGNIELDVIFGIVSDVEITVVAVITKISLLFIFHIKVYSTHK